LGLLGHGSRQNYRSWALCPSTLPGQRQPCSCSKDKKQQARGRLSIVQHAIVIIVHHSIITRQSISIIPSISSITSPFMYHHRSSSLFSHHHCHHCHHRHHVTSTIIIASSPHHLHPTIDEGYAIPRLVWGGVPGRCAER
jgi:hypothetical protein